jgi:hypothetical protein
MLSMSSLTTTLKNPIRGMIPGLPTHEVGGKTAIEPVLPIVALPHEVSHEGSKPSDSRFSPAHRLWRAPQNISKNNGLWLDHVIHEPEKIDGYFGIIPRINHDSSFLTSMSF